ncbi:hypothetical protein AgCh_011556 [Apium graveolens]
MTLVSKDSGKSNIVTKPIVLRWLKSLQLQAMATIKDLPYELLCYIIFLLVQSSGGAEEFARIIAVCRDFLLCAEAKSVLRVVKFDIKMEPFKFYQFQNVKGLLVKCSEAGNEAAQHVLGKVILLSSAHLFLSERQQVSSSGMGAETIFLLKEYIVKCARGGVDWHEAMNDMNFVEALREDISNRLNEAYADFSMTRAGTLGKFERKFG